ncbi:MAG: 16S rRNA (cytosine(1402)-N(4))-methyltransferase RsmH [Pseudomonadota bacterium]|nr:16S rRNA (cytosine(1402)-N(4))-methyltransferase RsmH [Pseudomonadota bacterium]
MVAHEPVLVEEAVDALALAAQPGVARLYVDATFGRGGHAARILDRLGSQDRLLAIDRDPEAIAAARARFGAEPRLVVAGAAFGALASLVQAHGQGRACAGVLFDLGVSSPQLDDPARGFSFQADGPLDMRMDPARGESAAAWLARAPVDEIRDVIRDLGEERHAGRIARAIVEARSIEPLTRTGQLAQLIARVVRGRDGGKHPATRTFQAIRMHVNDELGELRRGLAAALEVLAPGGRLAVISFHSLEDRIVKQFMRSQAQPDPAWARLPIAPDFVPALKPVGKKRRATEEELARNPRARSAVLRVAERLDAAPVQGAAW